MHLYQQLCAAFFVAQLQPVALRKTTALINHFIVSTTKFLNHFSSIAEEKLEKLSQSVERVEVELDILEAKLEKIEGAMRNVYATLNLSHPHLQPRPRLLSHKPKPEPATESASGAFRICFSHSNASSLLSTYIACLTRTHPLSYQPTLP